MKALRYQEKKKYCEKKNEFGEERIIFCQINVKTNNEFAWKISISSDQNQKLSNKCWNGIRCSAWSFLWQHAVERGQYEYQSWLDLTCRWSSSLSHQVWKLGRIEEKKEQNP